MEGVEENGRVDEGTGDGREGDGSVDEDEEAKARGAVKQHSQGSVCSEIDSVVCLLTSSYVCCSP